MNFPVEKIEAGILFKWVPRSRCDDSGRPQPEVYEDSGTGMSTAWDRHCTAEECRALARRPKATSVVALSVAGVHAIDLATDHAPRPLLGMWIGFPRQAQSHTNVLGEKDLEIQMKLWRLAGEPVLKAEPKGIGDAEAKKAAKAERSILSSKKT